jgi:hypothetical protein
MEFIHKKKAEVQRTKMLSDQNTARRERTKEKRIRREQRIAQKRTELLGKPDDDDTNVAVQQALEQQAQTAVVIPAPQSDQPAPARTGAKPEKKPKQTAQQPAQQQQQPAQQQQQPKQETKPQKKK